MNQKLRIPHSQARRSMWSGGLGSWPHNDGVAFSVWAPNADAVSVVGSFNDWWAEANPLIRDDNGIWFADIAGAAVGDEYRYRIRYRGNIFDRIDPRARQVTHSQGNAVIYDSCFDWSGDDFTCAPLNQLVFYEMHIGTFHGQGEKPGTFDTAIEQLGHLKALGVNAIQLMPVVEFPGERSWGYEPSHPFAVEAAYGGPDALKRFVHAAHREGIAVFQDVIYNHFGPRDLHLWRFDGWFENERGGIYFYQDDRADSPWGSRPDYGRREVRDYILDNACMWVEEYHVDGLRLDGTYFIRTAGKHETEIAPQLDDGWTLLCELTDLIRGNFPRTVTVAEDMRGEDRMTKPTAEGGAGFHLQWTDRFAHGVRYRATDAHGQRQAQRKIATALSQRFDQDPFQRVIYVESHDNAGKGEKVLTTADPDDPDGLTARMWLMLATVSVFTAPGIPLIFQGQELLTPDGFDLANPKSIDWSRAERDADFLHLHGKLIQLRRNIDGTTKGLTGSYVKVIHQNLETGILAWQRWCKGGPGDDVIVVLNFSGSLRENYFLDVPEIGTWYVRFNSAWNGAQSASGPALFGETDAEPIECDGLPARISVSVAPWGSLMLSQNSHSLEGH